MNTSPTGLRVASLFSGAGGLDLGLREAGHQLVWANDVDRDCVATYRQNIGNHIVLGDLASIPSSDVPPCDVVVGGFPCQGFSQANKFRSVEDQRNQMYLEFLRIVKDKQPHYFLAENVRGILTLDQGGAMKLIESDFESAGYRVKKWLFNLADFGVPQLRQRVIIAGTRKDIEPMKDFCPPLPTHAEPSRASLLGLAPWRTISDALRSIPSPDAPNDLPNHQYSAYKVTNRDFTGHRWTDPNRPSPTILARGNGQGGVCAIQHPSNTRRMSVREQATIQTFPLDFEFIGSMSSCYRQVGNAVPVLFGSTLGVQLHAASAMRISA